MGKVIDNAVYIQAILDIVAEGKQAALKIKGTSMVPFLGDGRDTILLDRLPGRQKIKKGDVILFQRDNGQYVLHRVSRVQGSSFYFLGDSQFQEEGPIAYDQLRAMGVSAVRKGKILTPDSLLWKFFAGPWMNLTIRRAGFRLRGKKKIQQ